jgi:hypothetical protein
MIGENNTNHPAISSFTCFGFDEFHVHQYSTIPKRTDAHPGTWFQIPCASGPLSITSLLISYLLVQ